LASVKDSSAARDGPDKGLGGIADERWRRERADAAAIANRSQPKTTSRERRSTGWGHE